MKWRRILHAFTMTSIIIGMFYFYMISDFHLFLWYKDRNYYIFVKGIEFFLILCVAYPLQEFKKMWLCMGAFFVVRCLWEVLAIKDYASASQPSIIFILFLADTLCLVLIMVMQIRRK